MGRKRKKKLKVWAWFEKHMTPVVVVFSISTVLIFTTIDIILAANQIMISDVLTEWVYKFFGLEMLALSGIKISKHVGSAFGKVEEKIDGIITEEEDNE